MGYRRTIGERIKRLRKRSGLGQIELAQKLGYRSTGMLSLIESGQRCLDIKKIPQLCRILGVTPNDLLWPETSTTYSETSEQRPLL